MYAGAVSNSSSAFVASFTVPEDLAEATSNGAHSARVDSNPAAEFSDPLLVRGVTNKVVGVLGGGQLGRMLCQAASPLGISVDVLDPAADAPAGPIAHRHVVGDFKNLNAIREFAKGVDVLTVEIEHVNTVALQQLEDEGVDVEPKAATIRIIQDKFLQKQHFRANGVPLPDFVEIPDLESAMAAGRSFGFPLMLKSRRDAYDGKGNAVAKEEEEIEAAVAALGGFSRGLYAEKWAPFVKELAVMVARGRDGEVKSFPLTETTHKDNICHTVLSPPLDSTNTSTSSSSSVESSALSVAEKAVGCLQGAGVFGVELFLLPDGQVLLNEVAPRPHNSGHLSIEACAVSQYEQHLRAVLGLPLGDSSLKVPAAGMVNLLGEADGDEGFLLANEVMARALGVPGASVHWYAKSDVRKQRKIGHITVVGPSSFEVRSRLHTITPNVFPRPASADAASSAGTPVVGVIMGSDSDLPVMKQAAQMLEYFGVPYELTIVSAHRTPARLFAYATGAHKRGLKVIIAGAGGAAHLPGMVASLTPLPVVGVPVKGSTMDGMDSLLSIVQMPRGIPVATVAVNNSANAGILAARILATSDQELLQRMISYQDELESMVLSKATILEEQGWEAYLEKNLA